MSIVERVAQAAMQPQAASLGTSQIIHDHLKKAEPHYLQFLHEQTKTSWHMKKFEGPTEHGETLITWDGGDQGTLTLVAMAVSDKVVDIRLHYADSSGMPEQPRVGRVSIDKVGDAKTVLGNLLAKYRGKTPWTKPKDKAAYLVAAAFLERKLAEQGKAAPKKVDDLHKEVKEGNPSYTDEQAWATAWSIYCKSVDPNGEHCHESPEQYLKATIAWAADDQASISRPTPSAENQLANDGEHLYHSIRPGDQVTIVTPRGQQLKGRAVMKGPAGWVLNLGGAHGRPGIASPENIVKVKSMGAKQNAWGIGGIGGF
jgi:hypothetical protein